jgi:hydrogenase maturation protease
LAGRHFVHRVNRHLDPAFLRYERRFLETERSALRVMERHRDHLQHDLEVAKQDARQLGVALEHAPDSGYAAWLTVIGVGNRFRHDDAAGLEVAARLHALKPAGVRVVEEEGEPGSLLEAWAGVDEALVIDCVNSNAPAGRMHRFEVGRDQLPVKLFRPSTHALGVADAVELARELDRLPRRLAVYGIEGENFEAGEGLSPIVEVAVQELVDELYAEFGGR